MLVEQPSVDANLINEAAAEALGVTVAEVDSFVEGFDGGDFDSATSSEWFDAGERMRQEILAEEP
jgi:hypothetical protein